MILAMPLKCGGADAQRNIQWQTEEKAKAAVE